MELINKYCKRKPRLNSEQIAEAVYKAQEGDIQARNTIIESNVGLCMKQVGHYFTVCQRFPRIEFEDLFQEGILSLNRAIDLFDPARGFAFSTYAMWWLRQSMERYIDNNKTLIRVPVFASALQRRFAKVQMEIDGQDEDFYIRLIAFEENKSPESVRASLQNCNPTTESIFQENEDGEPLHQFEDLTTATDTTKLDASIIKQIAEKIPEREKQIILARMDNWSLGAISEQLKLSKERVRQLEASALIKLRAMVNVSKQGEKYGNHFTSFTGKEIRKTSSMSGRPSRNKRI